MSDVIEVSYTGDLLAHRRCPRAWCYEKHAGFVPYEQVQAMEGRLLHHAMEWMARFYADKSRVPRKAEVRDQLDRHYNVLRARGITTAFTTREDVLERITGNLFRGTGPRPAVRAVVIGAQHSEYELRAVRKVLPAEFGGKHRILLTGIIDLVLQQEDALTYRRTWTWTDRRNLQGTVKRRTETAAAGDREIWDFKASRAKTPYLIDYVRQVVTYAALYQQRTGELPKRCVLFFVNEPEEADALVSIPIDDELVDHGLRWTEAQVADLQRTVAAFEEDPNGVEGGTILRRSEPVGKRIDDVLRKQCTGCAQRFDCQEYLTVLGSSPRRPKRDVDPLEIGRN